MNLYHFKEPKSIEEAIQIQKEISSKIITKDFSGKLNLIAGVDISFDLNSNILYGGMVILNYPDLTLHSFKVAKKATTFPYVPGLLSFREIPVLLDIWQKITIKPDLIMADGQGIAHPRGCGIASHLGFILDIPTIGCAKSLLVGKFDSLDTVKGSRSDLIYKQHLVGYALRTKDNINPVYVSPGFKTGFQDAVELTLKMVKNYKIPEPTRIAHKLVNAFRTDSLDTFKA